MDTLPAVPRVASNRRRTCDGGGIFAGRREEPQGKEADLPDGGEKGAEEQEQHQPQREEADLPEGGEKAEEEQEQEQQQGDETDLPDGGVFFGEETAEREEGGGGRARGAR